MKKTLIAFGLIVCVASCSRQNRFTISGRIEGLKGKVVLHTLNNQGKSLPSDSVTTEDGSFAFQGSLVSPSMARLTLNGNRSPEFFLENSVITVTGHADSLGKLVFDGSKLQKIVKGIDEKVDVYQPQMMAVYEEYKKAKAANDEAVLAKIEAKSDSLDQLQMDIQKMAVVENSGNAVGPYLVYRRLRYTLNLADMKSMTSAFTGDAATNVYATLLNDCIKVLETVDVDQIAPDFTMEDPDNKPITLSSYRGKYLLIDFWASWCGPCRQENPNVAKLYNSVKGKDFDILGVSLDTKRENWLKAIKDDGLVWHHVSDLKGWDNRVAKLYGVSSIPHTVLLDKEGKIIEKNLRGEKLREKIKELLK